jgi:putative transposase
MYSITGITGQVGGAVARALLTEGANVRAVARDASKAAPWVGAWLRAGDCRDERCHRSRSRFRWSGRRVRADPPIFDPSPGFAETSAVISAVGVVTSLAACWRFECGVAHLDEVFVKVNGKLCYLWRAVDEGEVLEAVVTAEAGQGGALKLLKRIMKRYGRPRKIVTDGLCSYCAAMKQIGNADRHEVGRRLNNRAENSRQPFRRREHAMQRFGSMKTLQKFSSVHAEVKRHLVIRQVYKQRRAGALAKWRALAA